MALDKELEDAIRSAVADAKQPATVSQRLVAWVRELSERGELGVEDQSRHLENVRNALKLGEGSHED